MGKRKPLKIVILGMMGRCPFGGQTWLYLNWLRAFSRLGHDVYYIEDDTVWPYDPIVNHVTDDCTYAISHIRTCMKRIGLEGKWAFRLADKRRPCHNMTARELDSLYRSCDLLVNVVGATDLRDVHLRARRRIYVETDPVTAELRLANGDRHTREAFAQYDHIITYGENYGAPDCDVPLCGIRFGKIRQPIDLDLWPASYVVSAKYFTTIGNYRQKGSDVKYNGKVYRWSKHHEWEKYIELPQRTNQPFRIAVMPDAPKDRQKLESNGWRPTSPFQMSLDVFGAYRKFFRESRGQFTVAKDQNVRLRSGWFSERDICYLASGKPIVVQDTGFSKFIPTGEGLFAFSDMDGALRSIEAINRNYKKHCTAARHIARLYFSAPKIGRLFLQQVDLA